MINSVVTRDKDIKRTWQFVDIKDQVLGRTATKIAGMLAGRAKPYFVRNLDCGDYVVVINARQVRVTGKKTQNKIYTQFSGFPGGLKKTTFANLQVTNPAEIVRHAVYGMLPDNKLRDQMMKRLHIYPDDKHPYGDKFKEASSV